MSNWTYLNDSARVRKGMFSSHERDGFNGMFEMWIVQTRVKCVASDGKGWQHVSVSLVDKPNTPPKWDVMCAIKDLFWDDEDCVIQFHPQKSRYITNHPGVLHLWRCTDGREQPQPPDEMVGLKKWNDGKGTPAEMVAHWMKVSAKPE